MGKRFTQKEAAAMVRDPRSTLDGARVYLEHGYSRKDIEIVVHDDRGPSFRVTIGKGSAGISARVQQLVGSAPLSVSGNAAKDWEVLPNIEAYEIDATIYGQDDYSQDFKRWYHAAERDAHCPERDDYDARGMRKAN